MALLLSMWRVSLPFNHEDNNVRDVGCAVGNPFEVLEHEQHSGPVSNALGMVGHIGQQFLRDPVREPIRLAVVRDHGLRQAGVVLQERLKTISDHALGDLRQSRNPGIGNRLRLRSTIRRHL